MNNPIIEIPYHDGSIGEDINLLKKDLIKEGVIAFETQRGLLETRVRATAPPQFVVEFLDYTKFVVVFIVTSYFAGIAGAAGVSHYKTIISWVKKLAKKAPGTSILFISDLDRQKDFPLRVCFHVSISAPNETLLSALNAIPGAIGIVKREIQRHKDKQAIVISFSNGKRDIENSEIKKVNRGTSSLAIMRSLKLSGICEKKYFPDVPGETQWELMNTKIPKSAERNALKHRIEYYQRLHSANDIKYAVHQFWGASVSVDIFRSILSAPNGNVPMPSTDDKPIGQHCISAKGYNKDGLMFANSWGTEWGNKGCGVFSWGYINKYLIEAWGQNIFVRPSFKYLFKPRVWKSFFKDRRDRKVLQKETWQDKRSASVIYELLNVPTVSASQGYFFILNFFDKREKYKKKGGWVHFSFKDSVVELEDIFVDEKNRNCGWGNRNVKYHFLFLQRP